MDMVVQRDLEFGFVEPTPPVDDARLVARIADSYSHGRRNFEGHGGSIWAHIASRHEDVHRALEVHDLAALTHILRHPAENDLFWGFEGLGRTLTPELLNTRPTQLTHARGVYGALVHTALGTGAMRCAISELGQSTPQPPVDELLDMLDQRLGYRVEFPNPYHLEFGLRTSRGIASFRAIQAVYQAWRVTQLAKVKGAKRILEIGAGLGRTAYYARQLSAITYTIVDIPMTQVAQGYFLGRVVGECNVSLAGETKRRAIRLRSPAWLDATLETFDVILNVDSLPELDRQRAVRYLEFARDQSQVLLSINHEFYAIRVLDLLDELGMVPASRAPYWPRAGYVEELFINRSRTPRWLGGAIRAIRRWRATEQRS
jgi:hypothetical protein